MIPLVLTLIIITVFLLSSLFIYVLIYSRENFKSSSSPFAYGKRRIKYVIQPSMNIITRRLSTYRSSFSIHHDSNLTKPNQTRSYSLANNLSVVKYPHRRRSSIIDSKQIAQIQFEVPLTAEKYRRRSVAVCNNIIETKQSTIDSIIKTIQSSNQILPCLVSFSIIYLESSQIKIQFHSLTSLLSTIKQLTIKLKLNPDGKAKELSVKKILPDQNIFAEENTEYFIQFSHIPLAKLAEKTLVIKFYGKNQEKKTIQLGQIGKIYFNQIENIENKNQMDFIHEIENIKMSSIEILVSIEKLNDHNLIIDLKRIKGLKYNQKNPNATCFFRIILLDRHRPLTTHETKFYRLNSSTFSLQESRHFNILSFNSNHLDRLMIRIDFYSNINDTNEHHYIGRIKLGSPYICSGSGTIHWQQFKQRHSFSMWHTLIKQ
ncbi:unnamed protein product [Adineta steineri]|uniref:Uncharacterized protein n=1 Tax=Adineta steineri TaxID=433720 RepID=A0A815BWB5_9BILA|nr:unnamed protein product [Adineta steineri]CAF1559826.1 unnamed protein product [Adineta steineri]